MTIGWNFSLTLQDGNLAISVFNWKRQVENQDVGKEGRKTENEKEKKGSERKQRKVREKKERKRKEGELTMPHSVPSALTLYHLAVNLTLK